MSSSIDFYFDFGSPTSYLAYKRLNWLEENYDVSVNPIPVLLGGIFKATGNHSPVEIPLKGQWMANDLQRFASLYDVPFAFNPFFPINTISLMRGAVYAQQQGELKRYMDVVFDAMWSAPQNLGDLDILGGVLSEGNLDAAAIVEGVSQQAVKDELIANTQQAVERGVFGCPAMFYEDQLFFGQDRMFFIERMLSPS